MKYLKELRKWHEIPGFMGHYMITNRNGGMVKSIDRPVRGHNGIKVKKGKILKQFKRKYWSVGLSKRNFVKFYTVHKLLATVFIPNPQNKPTVNHENGNKLDNRLSNLKWATHSEQLKHAVKMGLFAPPTPTKGKFGSDHNRSMEVTQYDMNGNPLRIFGSASEAARETGFHQTGISKSCRGESKQHKGYLWSYSSNGTIP